MTTSLVVPVLNEADRIERFITHHRDQFSFDEIVLVDGGSTDGTDEIVREFRGIQLARVDRPGRGNQLAEGVRRSRGEYLVFLHADSRLDEGFRSRRLEDVSENWGWFTLRIDGGSWKYRLLEQAIRRRSRRWMKPTGDEAIWCRRSLLNRAGGVPRWPLMEDVGLVENLRRLEPGTPLDSTVRTSSRRWKSNGYVRTIVTTWWYRVLYRLRLPPEKLYERYYGQPLPE